MKTTTRKFRILLFACLWLSSVGVITASAFQLGAESRPAKDRIERARQEGEARENLQIDQILARLKLNPGDIVVDVGAGTGTFSWPLAQAVGPTGKLLAVEIDQELLAYIDEVAEQRRLDNVETVLGEFDDPKLPTRQVDLAFIHQVLHHVANRALYLKTLAGYIKPDGRIVVIDADQGQPNASHSDEPEFQYSKDELKQWMDEAGFHPVEEYPTLLDRKFFYIFARQ